MKWLLTSYRSAELIKSLECFTLLDGDRSPRIPTLTGDLTLYEWIKSHLHSYWTAQQTNGVYDTLHRLWMAGEIFLLHVSQSTRSTVLTHINKSLDLVSSLWTVKESTEGKLNQLVLRIFFNHVIVSWNSWSDLPYHKILSLKMFCSRDKWTCYLFVVNCKTPTFHKPWNYINNKHFRMLNFQQNP